MFPFFRVVLEVVVAAAFLAVVIFLAYSSVVMVTSSPLWRETPSRGGISVPPGNSASSPQKDEAEVLL
jgi:hypothetical protein